MDLRISLITLGVADLARSRRFYVDGLGWPASSASFPLDAERRVLLP